MCACIATSSCGLAPDADDATARVVIGTTDRVSDLDPASSYDFHTWEVHGATMSGLVIPGPDGQLLPDLAQDLPQVSEDQLTWTVTLKQGLRFPSGRELTAEDVVWSVNRVARLDGKPSWFVSAFLDNVEALDTYTIAFHLLEPASFFPSLLAVPPYFPIDQTCYSADSVDSDSTCGGVGRYVISQWRRDDTLVLEANPDWQGKPARTKQIVVKYLPDSATMTRELVDHTIDLAWNSLSPEDIEKLRGTQGVHIVEGHSNFKRLLVLTTTHKPFDDPSVRQALSLLINRQELADKAFRGTHSPLYSPIPRAMPGHIETLPRFNVEAGRAMLERAGFSASRPLSFELWWTTDHYGEQESELANLIKKQLESTGMIQVQLRAADWNDFNDKSSLCECPAFLLGWFPDYLDPSTTVDFFGLSTATPDLCSNYANPEMDKLIRAAQKETDIEQRLGLYEEIQRLWASDVPTIPLTEGLMVAAASEQLEGTVITGSGTLRYDLLRKHE